MLWNVFFFLANGDEKVVTKLFFLSFQFCVPDFRRTEILNPTNLPAIRWWGPTGTILDFRGYKKTAFWSSFHKYQPTTVYFFVQYSAQDDYYHVYCMHMAYLRRWQSITSGYSVDHLGKRTIMADYWRKCNARKQKASGLKEHSMGLVLFWIYT